MFLSFRADVERALSDALSSLDLPADELGIEQPPEDVDAVLASSVAFRLASAANRPPVEIASELAEAIEADSYEYLDDAVALGPYVNFLPSDAYFAETLEAARSPDYGRLPSTGESVVVEHTSANPTGPVHVGRARNPIIGDAIVRVLDFAGNDVAAHYYVNDAGRQMAVFAWAYETFDEADLPEPEREKADYDLVRYYRAGNAFLEEGPAEEVAAAEDEIAAIMQGLEDGDEAAYERVAAVVDAVLSGMNETLARLPADFDEFVKETQFLRDGSTDDVVARLKELDCAIYEDDAWQLDLTGHGIEKNLVFLRSDGTSLYPTRDLAHHEWKFAHFDRAVTVLGEDHELQAEQVGTALELLGADTSRLEQVLYSYVNLPEGKMSTRRGTGIDLDDLLDEAIARAREEVESRLDTRIRDDDLAEEDIDRIARQVGVGAVRYDIVSKQPTKSITFEWERALNFEAQSAPYVQYVHARTCGILAEAGARTEAGDSAEAGARTEAGGSAEAGGRTEAGGSPDAGEEPPATVDSSLLATDEERELLAVIARFPLVIEEAADSLEPHVVATYTREFAETFNAFYRECPVLADNVAPELRAARLALVTASKHTIANALTVLGVEAPESM